MANAPEAPLAALLPIVAGVVAHPRGSQEALAPSRVTGRATGI